MGVIIVYKSTYNWGPHPVSLQTSANSWEIWMQILRKLFQNSEDHNRFILK